MKKSIAIVKAHKETGNVITMREITNAKGETEEVGTVMVQSTEVGNLSGIGSQGWSGDVQRTLGSKNSGAERFHRP